MVLARGFDSTVKSFDNPIVIGEGWVAFGVSASVRQLFNELAEGVLPFSEQRDNRSIRIKLRWPRASVDPVDRFGEPPLSRAPLRRLRRATRRK
ncbi:MAG: hypothetical protein MZW92_04835 [Comamonadaceae bacterium]|nr:hypothetical protein [Comamonadaceae bacterium]